MDAKLQEPLSDLSDWQIWLGTVTFRWLPVSLQLLSIAMVPGTVIWVMVSPLEHYWVLFIKLAGGSIVCWGFWRLARFSHSICSGFHKIFYVTEERRLREKDLRGYFLYLRSFRDQTFAVQSTTLTPEEKTTLVLTEELSARLERSLAKYGRIIMIGEERSADSYWESSLMAKTDDANWWSVFCRLVEHARCILVVPEVTLGLRRELTEILRGPHRNKVVVVMSRADAEGRRAQRWAEVCSALEPHGFQLPTYEPMGCFYLPDQNLGPEKVFLFNPRLPVTVAMRRAFRDIHLRIGPGKVSLKEAITSVTLQ
ncbi:MAG: hypothetical protein CV088_15035 [Nitrospira sp. LK70]|nr:hypothetical protein [Nitrospira sp. LK70]